MGNIINGLSIIFGGLIGSFFGKKIPKKMEETVVHGLGLAVILIGVSSMMESSNILHIIIAIVLGGILGEYIDVDGKFNMVAKRFEKFVSRIFKGDIASGMVYASLIYCVGPMAILGSIEMALFQSSEILIAKAAIDGVTAIAFASVLGIGVVFSSIVVFIYQGLVYLLAFFLGDFATPEIIMAIKGLGGMLIFAIGFNILDIKKIKVANLLPAFLFIIILTIYF
ncbi:DUF554 domain-containing protein [Alkalicella caledoniensis]|uniref:DUF554 domain-containing protein n=1 Tax=Alkalicella caledoniensis TaxID=2731377 RepID=A0A7G9W8J9_ALKCA|nr:DUF554 domain-containing protein [Alkalicella caledoniensis]QNO15011.1 DUF554 domain-containing protein [Alkalicella caledoniensis]